MLNFTCKADFSDVSKAFGGFRRQVRRKMEEVGDEAVDYAIQNGSYQNRTGHLRKSNKREVTDNELSIINEAEYASYVEAKGYDVISGAALFAEKRLKEIFE